MLAAIVRGFITTGAKLLTGAQGRWIGCAPEARLRIYCSNHTSHMDFLLLWTALPRPPCARQRGPSPRPTTGCKAPFAAL